MSTRCHITFTDGFECVKTYRHSDGYPNGVLPDLKDFQKWENSSEQGKRSDDLEYTVANWLYWAKSAMHEQYCKGAIGGHKPKKGEKHRGWCLLGYGVCSHGNHGDVEYNYLVDLRAHPWLVTQHDTKQELCILDADKAMKEAYGEQGPRKEATA